MYLAAEWLESNNGDNGEAENCKAVAAWLNHKAHSAEVSAVAKKVAKENGVPTGWVKARVAAIMANPNGIH